MMAIYKANKTLVYILAAALFLVAAQASALVRKIDEPFVFAKDIIRSCGDYCDVQIAESPVPGNSLVIREREILASLLDAGYSVKKRQVPKKIKIIRTSRSADADEMTDKARKAILSVIPQGVSVERIGRVNSGKVPKSEWDVRATFDESKMFQRSISFPIEYAAKGVVFRKVYVVCRLAYTVNVPVAARGIAKDEIVSQSSITYRELKIEGRSVHFIVDPDEIVGTRSKVALSIGAGFEKRNLEIIPIVRRGDAVTVVSNMRGIKISVRGYARQNAIRGQRIAVEIPSLNKLVFAKMLSPGYGVVQK